MLSVVGFLAGASQGMAQSEESLRRFFEGKSVVVKLEMPGTEEGIDVWPGTSQPVDFPRVAKRLKQYGTAIRRGQEMLVTKVRVNKDLIEFQLGGGGYGTFGDETGTDVSTVSADKTAREKNLEKELPGALAASLDFPRPGLRKGLLADEVDAFVEGVLIRFTVSSR